MRRVKQLVLGVGDRVAAHEESRYMDFVPGAFVLETAFFILGGAHLECPRGNEDHIDVVRAVLGALDERSLLAERGVPEASRGLHLPEDGALLVHLVRLPISDRPLAVRAAFSGGSEAKGDVAVPFVPGLFVDGRPLALPPDSRLPMLAGEHEVYAEREGFDPLRRTVTIEANQDGRLELRLVPNARTVILRTEPEGVEVTLDGDTAYVFDGGGTFVGSMISCAVAALASHRME